MKNILPEKLVALRKVFRYAQADVAQQLNVSVNDYMSWENGSAVPNIAQCNALSEIYHVSLEELFDNARTLTLPSPDLAFQSVEIPFKDMVNAETAETSKMDDSVEYMPFAGVETDVDHADYEEPVSEKTRQIEKVVELSGTREFEPTSMSEIVEETPVHGTETKQKEPNKKMIGAIVAAIVAAIALLFFIISRFVSGGSDPVEELNTLSQTNRFALGDTFTLYLQDNGTISTTGTAPNLDGFTDVVQVSAGNGYAMGLKKDGTVVCSGSSSACGVYDWKEITAIDAGIGQSAGVTKEGTVLTTDSSLHAEIENWSDIVSVSMGENILVGLTKDRTLKVAGNTDAKDLLETLTNVKLVEVGLSQVAVVRTDGTLTCYALNSGSTSATSDWTNINGAALTNGYAAGLREDRTVVLASTDEDLLAEVSSWKSIRYIAGYGDTLVALGQNNTVYGIGDNSYHVYTEAKETADPTADADKLETVKNVKFNVSTGNLTISWDVVQDASSYEITVSTNPVTTMKSAKNTTSIATSKLTDGNTYTVTIKAISSNSAKIADSDTYQVDYKYESAVKKLATPSGITFESTNKGWKIAWSAVENAGYYEIKVGDQITMTPSANVVEIDASKLENGKTYAISIVAKSGDAKYTDSDEGKTSMQYTTKTVAIKVTFQSQTNSNVLGTINVGTVNVGQSYSFEITAPDGYVFTNDQSTTTITGNGGEMDERTIQVKEKKATVTTPEPEPVTTPKPDAEETEPTE